MSWFDLRTAIQVVAIIAWWEVCGKLMKRLKKRFRTKVIPFEYVGFDTVEGNVVWSVRMK